MSDWTYSIIDKIQKKEKISKCITETITNSVDELNKAFKEKGLQYQITNNINEITETGFGLNGTSEVTVDAVIKAIGTDVMKIGDDDIKSVIRELIYKIV